MWYQKVYITKVLVVLAIFFLHFFFSSIHRIYIIKLESFFFLVIKYVQVVDFSFFFVDSDFSQMAAATKKDQNSTQDDDSTVVTMTKGQLKEWILEYVNQHKEELRGKKGMQGLNGMNGRDGKCECKAQQEEILSSVRETRRGIQEALARVDEAMKEIYAHKAEGKDNPKLAEEEEEEEEEEAHSQVEGEAASPDPDAEYWCSVGSHLRKFAVLNNIKNKQEGHEEHEEPGN
jgi:hypothetical protein